ncbi:MAG: VapE domain-containing protein [Bacilli bacterium]
MIDMINLAKKYVRNNFSVLPINKNSKRPNLTNWKRLQDTLLTEKECERAFYEDCYIGVIGGAVSGNLEMIDIDNHLGNAQEMFDALSPLVDTFGLPYEKTKNHGFHIFYRCSSSVEGNQKLAMMTDEKKKPIAVIETRGEGGYCVIAPSKGYEFMEGDLFNTPLLDREKRDLIISECRALGTYVKEKEIPHYNNTNNGFRVGERAGDRYNVSSEAIAECRDLLRLEGWTFSTDGTFVRRPDKKDKGWSATFGKVTSTNGGYPLFYVFSSNAYPFESMSAYSPFSIFAILAYKGDFSMAAKEIGERYNDYQTERTYGPFSNNIDVKKVVSSRGEEADPQCFPTTEVATRMSKDSKPLPIDNTIDYFNMAYDFRYDIIKNIVQYKPRTSNEWEVCNANDLYIELLQMGIKIKKDDLKSLLGSRYVPRYDAFKDYFQGLPKWDGINYFVKLADYITVENKEYFTVMLEKMFVRTIKCALEPDFYNRFAFVLKSNKQEIGKSRLIQFFNPFGSDYFTSEFIKSDKDSIIALSENFIYNLDDLDDLNKQVGGIGKLKALLAKSGINVRAPYGAQKVHMDRRCSFFGSTNQEEFLTDDVNTRWLIFDVRKIDWAVFKKIDIKDLWTQAYAEYLDENYDWDLTIEEKEQREMMNLSHKESSMEQEILARHFEPSTNDNDMMSLGEITRRVSQLSIASNRFNVNLPYIQKLLVSMGYEEYTEIVANTCIRLYRIRERKA